jgi:hypothetical protein
MSIHNIITNMTGEWREDAVTLREYGAEPQALALEHCADALERGIKAWREAPLTLAQASALGGYTTDHLGRMVRQGKIPNAGRAGAPRIAREHVPIKSAAVAQEAPTGQIDREQIVRLAIA